jgi:hypothetical protein
VLQDRVSSDCAGTLSVAPAVGHDVGVASGRRGDGAVLRFRDVAAVLGVSVDDVHFLHHLGLLKPRDVWAVSAPTFDWAAVERCRRWLAEQALGPEAAIARLRSERDAELTSPDGLVPPARVGIAWNLYGPHYWQEAVGSGLGRELNEVRTVSDMEALEQVPLLPPEWRRPTNAFVTPDELVHVAVFIGETAGAWGIGKALDRLGTVIGRTAKRNSRYWQKQVAQAFWFVISIWHGAESFWAVIGFDVSPEHAAEYSLIQPAYQQIVRAQRREAKKRGAEKEAIVALVRDGRLLGHCQRFPNIDQALRGLGRVSVVSSGGPLEALWLAAHPRSSAGLRVCQALQGRPGRPARAEQLSVLAKAGTSTVSAVLRELTAMGAPVRQEPSRAWVYAPQP